MVVDHAERDDVADHRGPAADEGVFADAAELVDGGVAAEDDEVLDHGDAAERRVVAHDDAVADDAVMADMAARHEEALVANHRLAAPGHRAEMDGDVLADDVVSADAQTRVLALVLQVLRRMAQRGERDRSTVRAPIAWYCRRPRHGRPAARPRPAAPSVRRCRTGRSRRRRRVRRRVRRSTVGWMFAPMSAGLKPPENPAIRLCAERFCAARPSHASSRIQVRIGLAG